jgi:hypothetical protein
MGKVHQKGSKFEHEHYNPRSKFNAHIIMVDCMPVTQFIHTWAGVRTPLVGGPISCPRVLSSLIYFFYRYRRTTLWETQTSWARVLDGQDKGTMWE